MDVLEEDLSSDYQNFAIKSFEGLPHSACIHIDRPGAGLAPELMLCGSVDYHELKRDQLAAADALSRCRGRTTELAAAARSAADALAQAEERTRRQWRWVDDSAPNCDLPPSGLQDAMLAHAALTSAVRALHMLSPLEGLDRMSWTRPASREDQAMLAECKVLESRPHEREAPDTAAWRCWSVALRHTGQGRDVAVCCAVRKFEAPAGESFRRLLFGAAATIGEGSAAPVVEVEEALAQWRPPATSSAYQRQRLASQCEQLMWPREAAAHFQMRPACAPLLRQAAVAAEQLTQPQLALAADGPALDAAFGAAASQLCEALGRAGALVPAARLYRVAPAFSHELSLPSLLALRRDARCAHAARRQLDALLEYALGLAPVASACQLEQTPLPRTPGRGVSLVAQLATIVSLEAAGQLVVLLDTAEVAALETPGGPLGMHVEYALDIEVLLLLVEPGPSGYLHELAAEAGRPQLCRAFLELLVEQPRRRVDSVQAASLRHIGCVGLGVPHGMLQA